MPPEGGKRNSRNTLPGAVKINSLYTSARRGQQSLRSQKSEKLAEENKKRGENHRAKLLG